MIYYYTFIPEVERLGEFFSGKDMKIIVNEAEK